MITQIPHGQWQMRLSDQFPDTWEPWIIDPEKRICNSWSDLYDMLAESDVGISIPHAAATAVQFRHVHQVSKQPMLIGTFISTPKE